MSDQFDLPSTDRRSLMAGAAAAAAGAFLAPGLAVAASADLAVIRKAAEADKADAIKRLQEWIALPTVAAEGMNVVEGPAYMASAGMTPEQIAHYQQMPAWMTFVWALGVFTAFGASLLLLMRRKAAAPIFVLSLAAFLVSLLYTYVLTNGGAIMGQQMAIASTVIAVLLLLFAMYAYWAKRRLILR